MSADLDVAVVGAGIAGLAVARRLADAGRSVHVFESADVVGGRMACVRRDGCVFDAGAEMLGTGGYPATWRLLRELGMTTDDAPVIGRDIAVWRRGRARAHLGELRGSGLSLFGRAAMVAALGGRRLDTDAPESTPGHLLADVGTRELHDYLVQPLAGGFFGWDTRLACAGPMLAHLRAVGAPSTYRTYRGGMDTPARRLAADLAVSTGVPVRAVTTTRTGARLVTDAATLTARQIVLAVPAPVAAALHPAAPEYVHACEFRPMVKVGYLLDRPLGPPTDSFALAVPAVEDTRVAGLSFEHRKHPDRVPPGRGLVSVVATRPTDWLDADDRETAAALLAGAERYVPGMTAATLDSVVSRFRHGLPMPTPTALALRSDFTARPSSTVDYVGDWYTARPCAEGAVRSAELVADRVLDRRTAPVGSST
ncbi:FAD-dependent oxidoreductase [Actinokineospora sp. PR83]|uniref:protoporphyrinogen/coproporphyrinogen oxidase n=1 Tax=Actinokineospora sp. PR83 TaxID=2884908 RepID=UPI001F2E3DC4|nr:FAD-dependent oxidoreductase [Actinokineospora sp. PR83]MCG8914381.1 FAD-dependent oxidoreductase [Actinokineospora sp. PR83]